MPNSATGPGPIRQGPESHDIERLTCRDPLCRVIPGGVVPRQRRRSRYGLAAAPSDRKKAGEGVACDCEQPDQGCQERPELAHRHCIHNAQQCEGCSQAEDEHDPCGIRKLGVVSGSPRRASSGQHALVGCDDGPHCAADPPCSRWVDAGVKQDESPLRRATDSGSFLAM
jgi:hypothetical protein